MSRKITKTGAEWRAQLSPLAYKVTRKGRTERAGSHENFPASAGMFSCTCCEAELFDAGTKFESGTDWRWTLRPRAKGKIQR